jgi:hypothetical protein
MAELVTAKPKQNRFLALIQPLRRDDLTIAALGICLGLICALFPWYIFFNQEKFGPPSVTLDSAGEMAGARGGVAGQGSTGAGFVLGDPRDPLAPGDLDLFATGSSAPAEDEEKKPEGQAKAPLPPLPPVIFRVVHVANGRAMIDDGSGLFVVGPGDQLPDNSFVARIAEEGGRGAVITSTKAVLRASE